MTDLVGFVALAIVVIVTPGPDTALTIRNALVGRRLAGIATATGVALVAFGIRVAVAPQR